MAFNILTKEYAQSVVTPDKIAVNHPAVTEINEVATLKSSVKEALFPDITFTAIYLTRSILYAGQWDLLGFYAGGQGVISTTVSGNQVDVVTKTVVIPAYTTMYQPSSYLSLIPVKGWNSSAVSSPVFKDNGTITFRIDPSSSGVIAGLNEASKGAISTSYNDICYAFFTQGNTYRIMELGANKSAGSTQFSSDDVFKIQRVNGNVLYFVNDVKVREIATSITEDMSMDVSLYSSGDTIYDATLTNDAPVEFGEDVNFEATGDLADAGIYIVGDDVLAPPVAIIGVGELSGQLSAIYQDQIFESEGSLLVTDPRVGVDVISSFEPMVSLAYDSSYASSENIMAPMVAAGDSGLIAINTAKAQNVMASMYGYSTGLTGSTGNASDQEMRPLVGLSSDYDYASSETYIEPLQASAFSSPVIKDGNAKILAMDDAVGAIQGNGVLLETGRHILTAAHVVDGISDLSSIEVIFDTDITVSVPIYGAKSVIVHPNWLGDENLFNGYDIAIIELNSEVSALVRRHAIYKETDEVERVFSKRSFSPAVNPNTGVVSASSWEDISNRYDAKADKLNDVFDGDITIGNQLIYDWDNGNVINDAMGVNYSLHGIGVPGEGFTSAGDSGSAALIDGKIAGITSWHVTLGTPPDVLLGTNATYGEVAGDTRVSFFADWIEANSSGYTATAEIRFPTATIESLVTAGTLNGAEQLGGFTTEIEAYTGAYFETSNLSFELTANATNPVIARANSLRFPTASIESLVLTGTTAKATLNYALNKEIEAYTGAQAKSLGGFNTELTAAVIQGSTINASLKFPSISISASASDVSTGMANLRPPAIDMVWGHAELSGFKTKINAKSGVDCEVL